VTKSSEMLLRIKVRSGKPVFLWVVEQFKDRGRIGRLRSGEALSSICTLSKELRVNLTDRVARRNQCTGSPVEARITASVRRLAAT